MQKVLILATVMGVLYFGTSQIAGESVFSLPKSLTTLEKSAVNHQNYPKKEELPVQTPPKTSNKLNKLILEQGNTVVFRGVVTDKSVSEAILQLKKLSERLGENEEIYLVLDTPGGSIFAGLDLIDYAQAIPQKVHTVTLFAASMGFQFVQALDKRYIARTGTLMSHRASVGGLSGQVNGELEQRYKMIRRSVDLLDSLASTRMGLDVDTYRALILNEYWVMGIDAVNEQAADEQVLVACGSSMKGTTPETIMTFFGPVYVEWSKCPLVKFPVKISFENIQGTVEQKSDTEKYIKTLTQKKEKFVKDYITTGKWAEIQR